jgi:DNA-directed RNA polymerase subunit E'/Rpb7
MRKVLISLILQPRNYFLHQVTTLREEFICALFGRLVNIRIKFVVEAQKRYFAREDEIRQEVVSSECDSMCNSASQLKCNYYGTILSNVQKPELN